MAEKDNHGEKSDRGRAGITDLISSVVGLGEATTKFTIDQMQNAVGMLTHPTEALDRAKDSIDHFSKAMSSTVSGGSSRTSRSVEEEMEDVSEPSRASDALSGRKR